MSRILKKNQAEKNFKTEEIASVDYRRDDGRRCFRLYGWQQSRDEYQLCQKGRIDDCETFCARQKRIAEKIFDFGGNSGRSAGGF